MHIGATCSPCLWWNTNSSEIFSTSFIQYPYMHWMHKQALKKKKKKLEHFQITPNNRKWIFLTYSHSIKASNRSLCSKFSWSKFKTVHCRYNFCLETFTSSRSQSYCGKLTTEENQPHVFLTLTYSFFFVVGAVACSFPPFVRYTRRPFFSQFVSVYCRGIGNDKQKRQSRT